jgi:hypothetical protein
MSENDKHTETVPVEIHDPELSERANEIMTAEARAALGTDQVELPPERAHQAGRRHPKDDRLLAGLWERRVLLGMAAGAAVVVAAIIVLSTGEWGFIAIPLVLLVGMLAYVLRSVFETTTLIETPAPDVVADLEAEGVRDPERQFNEQIESFTAEDGGGPAGAGANQRTARPHEDAGRSTAEQQHAMTPSSVATSSAPAEPGQGGAPDVPDAAVLWPAFGAAALMLITLVVAAIEGGAMWIVPAVCWPLAIALIVYQVVSYRRTKASHGAEPGASADFRG